jgi:hypothetical protein
MLYGTNRDFSIRALKELEKQLIEYDLSGELIVVYKALAQLHLYTDEYAHFDNLYKKHVAFSLAVSKAEGLYYRFLVMSGRFLLTHDPSDLDVLINIKRELSNILELYDSHRLYVIYNVVRLYFMCAIGSSPEDLRAKELEVEQVLQEMNRIFDKYHLDTFYQNIRFITDFIYFEYYQRTGNQVRAAHYHDKGTEFLEDICPKHFLSFHIVRFLEGKIEKYLADNNLDKLVVVNDKIYQHLDIDPREEYQFIAFKRYQAICRFYQRDYAGAAKTINSLRNKISLKQYLQTDIECKLFQALQYCIVGEDGLCMQILSSLKRQIREQDSEYAPARLFIKLLKTALKPAEYRKKIKKITEMWDSFRQVNHGPGRILPFVVLDDMVIRKMTNPIKD